MLSDIENFLDTVDTPKEAVEQSKTSSKNVKKCGKKEKDPYSRFSGLDDFSATIGDMNSNFLIKNSASKMIGQGVFPTHTPMEIVGSKIYDKCENYLGPISVFCTIFNHLDWELFSKIAEERRKETKEKIDEINLFVDEEGLVVDQLLTSC